MVIKLPIVFKCRRELQKTIDLVPITHVACITISTPLSLLLSIGTLASL